MDKVIAHAPAKINLVLDVLPKEEGQEKHQVNSIFCTTTLCDTLIFSFQSGSEPFNAQVDIKSLDFDVSFIKTNDNSLIKVVEQFKLAYGFGFLPTGTLHVELIKSIPTQAGLGGGSSNAAAMLRMLCWLAQVEPTSKKSLEIARSVGADVPFFVHAPKTGLCAHMAGYGDELAAALPKPAMPLVLIKPQQGVSTKKAYEHFDESLKNDAATQTSSACTLMVQALEQSAPAQDIAALCCNNLEPTALQLVPSLAALKEELLACEGVWGAALSGSGSALFGICNTQEAATACMQHFANKGLWSRATHT